jgi:hypothetical protein
LLASMASAGDVNGDGYDDLVAYRGGTGDVGTAYVYGGSLDGVRTSPLAVFGLGPTGGASAQSVSRLGDVDGDGYGDVALAAYAAGPGNNLSGSVRVIRGTGIVLRAQTVAVSNGNLHVAWPSASGAVVRLERSLALPGQAWTDISGAQTSLSASAFFLATGEAAHTAASYRLRWIAAP